MLIERRFESNSSCSGTMLIGDCLRPFVHRPHSGFSRPQKFGPKGKGEENRKRIKEKEEIEKELELASFIN